MKNIENKSVIEEMNFYPRKMKCFKCGITIVFYGNKKPSISYDDWDLRDNKEICYRCATTNCRSIDPMNMSLLHYAALENRLESCKFLINKIDINILNDRNETPLDLAKDKKLIYFLESKGAKRSK
ncbi:MAG: ankyrin repeat domain-containing protein [Nanoarchaeota archaeon]